MRHVTYGLKGLGHIVILFCSVRGVRRKWLWNEDVAKVAFAGGQGVGNLRGLVGYIYGGGVK